MKQLIIHSLEMEQFQKFDYKKVGFDPRQTDISGDNGTGKTTIYSGLTWLLFGKDSYGREKFDIKHLVNGVKQDRVDVSVQGEFTLSMDGRSEHLTLKRMLVEKWDDKTDTYRGDETRCYINGVPKLVTEYNDFVFNIIAEEDFRIITSVTHFLSMKQDDQREYLCKMAGIREVKDIVEGVTEWERVIREMPSNMSLDDYVKSIKDSLKKYKDEKKGIQPSINALVQSMPEERNWEEIEGELKQNKSEIEAINNELSAMDADKEQLKKQKQKRTAEIERLEQEKREAKRQCDSRIAELRAKTRAEVDAKNRLYTETEQRLIELRGKLAKKKASLQSSQADESRLDIEVTQLYNQYMEESKKCYAESGCLMCPLSSSTECKTDAVLAIHSDRQEKLREEFNERKVKTLSVIQQKGKATKAQLDNAKNAVSQLSSEIDTLNSQIEMAQSRFGEMEKVQMPSLDSEVAAIEEDYNIKAADIDAKIDSLWDSAKAIHADNTDLQKSERRTALMKRNEELVGQLSDRTQIERMREKVDEITENGKQIATEITRYDNLLDVLAQIRRAVVEDATQRINEKFQVTKWVTSVQQKNGDWKDCCIPTIDGVSISLNTASRINVGLDICNAISRYLGISVPCFIDNRESVNEIVNLSGTQIINLRVAPKGTPLIINQ